MKETVPLSWKIASYFYKNSGIQKALKGFMEKKFLERIKTSTFYKKRIKNLDKVRKLDELRDFITTPEDLQKNFEEFIIKTPHIYFETSGTTGKPKRYGLSKNDFDLVSFSTAVGLKNLGINKKDLVLIAYNFNLFVSGFLIKRALEFLNIPYIPLGHVEPEKIYEKIMTYNPTMIALLPSTLIALTKIHEKINFDHRIRIIQTGGEHIPLDSKGWLQKIWKARIVNGYGLTEVGGGFAIECDEEKGYHYNPILYDVRIKAEKGSEFGEILISTIAFESMPLLNYSTGDIARFEKEKCSCKYRTPKISYIRGRKGNMFVAGGMNLFPSDFEKTVVKGAFLGVKIRKRNGVDEIVVRLTKNSDFDFNKLSPDIIQAVKRNELLVAFEYDEVNEKGKNPLIIDERKV